ncbi:MAG: cellulase family glycosylhydrolase [Acidobacteriota bacterium]|nr:cellulase family glycosylhydrolase [Acidobacteriota bacterium]
MRFSRSLPLHPTPLRACIVAASLLVLLWIPSSLHAHGLRLVSYNPHPVSGTSVPMASLADSRTHDVNAYHINTTAEVNAVLGFADYGKPKIISNDDSGFTTSDVENWIDTVCSDVCGAGYPGSCPNPSGEVHFEHFDQPLTVRATEGKRIKFSSDFPADSHTILDKINTSCASDLAAYKTLSHSGNQLLWDNEPVTLVGFSSMGAVVGLNFDVEGYLDMLEAHRVNLTRVWAVEQWTALAFRKPGAPHESNGMTPFDGTLSTGWDLSQANTAFFQRLQYFVDEAWERGIVVQLTLFDRHGVLNKTLPGQWPESPYNQANNSNGYFAAGPTNKAPTNFLSFGTTGAGALHRSFVLDVVNALKTRKNVLYEVMNEPKTSDWSLSNIVTFHDQAATVIKSVK